MFFFAFAAISENSLATNKVPNKSEVTKNKKTTPKGDSTNDWACCTVERNEGSATVCRGDGNVRKACRQARRFTRKR